MKIMPFAATWMDLEIVALSEVGQTEKEKYLWHPLYAESKITWKKWTYLQNRNILRERIYGCQGKGIVREFEMDRYTLLYLKWITNKDLLYRVEALLSVTWQLDGRGVWERMDTCVCVAELLHCPLETVTTLFIGYNPIKNTKLKRKVLYRLRQIFFYPQPWALFFSVLKGNHFCEAGVHCSYPRFH